MSSAPQDVPSGTDRLAELERQVEVQKARIQAIQEIGSALGSTLNLDRLLALIMEKTTELMDADRSTLYLLDEERAELWSKIAQGGVETNIRVPVGDGVAGWVAKTGKTLNIKDAYKDPRFNQQVDLKTGYRTTSMLCQPMRNHRRKIIGVIQVLNKRTGYFTVEDEQLLAALTSQAAISIENSKLYLSVVGKNIELLDTQDKLRKKIDEIDLLFRVEQEMNHHADMDALMGSLLRLAREAIPCAEARLALRETEGWRLLTDPERMSRETPSDDSPMVVAARTGEPVFREFAISVPLGSSGDCIGALELIQKQEVTGPGFTEEDVKLLSLIAGQAATGVLLARKRTEELNESRLAAIGGALSGVLHDLKTPMTIIGGYTQLMVDEDAPAERKELAGGVSRQIAALKSMMGEILGFARGEQNLLVRKVFVRDLMSEVEEALRQEFAGRGVELALDLGYDGPIRLDEGKIKRAIFNLARNAREAMLDGGTFTIRTALAEGGAEGGGASAVDLWFSDTGGGIPADIRSTLFDSFVTHGKENGTGLGLAIVKKVVEQHSGTIDYTSETGAGTSFHMRLPLNT